MKRKFASKKNKNNDSESVESNNSSDSNDDDLSDFVVSDDEIEIISRGRHLDKKVKNNPKFQEIVAEIDKREITEEMITVLDLSLEDSVWFIEHIRLARCMMRNTEEHYNMKNKIYERYKQVTSPEYDKLKNLRSSTHLLEDITTRIVNSKHSEYVKALLYRKYIRALENESTDEYFKAIEWIDCVLEIPTEVHSSFHELSLSERLDRFWRCINQRVYGLINVKEKVMESLCSIMLNKKHSGKIITLVGPPGVGKTLIAAAIAEAMEYPFDQISMNNINDPSVLIGHSSTYIGSRAGIFVDILRKNKRLDSLILLDEVDKIPHTEDGNSIAYTLLQILDKSQNYRFKDCYMPEIELDLSKKVFVLTANDVTRIPGPLRDRLIIINIDGYTYDDKINIIERHIYPRTMDILGFEHNKVKFDRNMIAYLVNKMESTPGVRNLERAVEQLLERLALIINTKNSNISLSYKMNVKIPIKIDKPMIDSLVDIK